MTIFNDQSSGPEQDDEMAQLKAGVAEAKKRMQEGREAKPVEDKPETRPKAKGKGKGKRE